MKKIFGLGSKKGESPLGSASSSRRYRKRVGRKTNLIDNSLPGYHIRDRDLGKIHKAASVGNVAKVQQILLFGKNGLNDRDKMHRTALHLACANGHSEVVTVLVERKCHLNLCDKEDKTALIKAVQCQDEKSVTILLEHGADPNVKDISGNTALHYAVFGQNISIAEKLLLHNADIEARNKAGLTPLLVAVNENKEQMVEFLVEKKANIHAVDNMKRTALMLAVNYESTNIVRLLLQQDIDAFPQDRYGWTADEYAHSKGFLNNYQLISRYKEGKTLRNSAQNSHPADECSEEDSSSRLSNKPDIDDSWPTSDSEDYSFGPKSVPKPSLRDLMIASQQYMRNMEAKCGTVRPEEKTLFDDNNSDSKKEDVGETLSKPPPGDYGCSHPAFPTCASLLKPSLKSLAVLGLAEEGTEKSATEKKLSDIVIENAPQEQTMKDTLTSDGAHKNNRSDMMSALGLGEEEDVESPCSSETISESVHKYVDHLSGAADQKGQSILNGQGEDVFYIPSCMSGSRNFKMAKREDTRNVGIPVAHMGAPEKYPHLKPTVEVENFVPDKTVGMKAIQTSSSDLSADLVLETTSEEEQERPDGSEINHPEVEEEKQHRSSEMEVSENIPDAAAAGIIQQRKNGKTDNRQFPMIENEDSDSSEPVLHITKLKEDENEKWTSSEPVITRVFEKAYSLTGSLQQMNHDRHFSENTQEEGRSAKKICDKKDKVKKQINTMHDFVDSSQSSKTEASEDCESPYSNYKNFMLLIEQLGMDCRDSVALLKIQDAVLSYERLIKRKENHCKLLLGKNKKMEKKVKALQKELSETKEMKSQLEHQKVEWERELSTLRFTLKQEEEKRRNADMLSEKFREEFQRKQEQYAKEVEGKQQLEVALRTLDMELQTVKKNLNQVSDSYEKQQDLLHTNHMLQDEIAMLRLEIDTIKNQNQGKEKKYREDFEMVKDKNDSLQKTIKQNEETLMKTILQYNGKVNDLTAEITMLTSKLENEKQNKERLEVEVESYRAGLAPAVPDQDQSQTSRKDLELAFQRARDEWFRLQAEMNFDVSNLKDNNEILSQQLSQVETKFNTLEIELHHTKDALREKTLVLECVQRDLSQTQCQKKEIEHKYQNEQSKVNKYIGKQESLEERLSQLQSENMLLRQQLDDANNKVDNKEKLVINIQEHFQDILKNLQAESEKQGLMLKERNKELIDECNHLKERMDQYENEKANRDVVVRQLQEELAETLKKQSMSEASLEIISRYRLSLEDETQDLKKKLDKIRSQLQEAQDGYTEAVRRAEKTEDHVQKLEVENGQLKVTIEKQADKIEHLQKNLLSTSLFEDDRQQLEKLIELKQSLEYSLDQEQKKNGELEKEISRFKKLFKMTRRKLNEYESGELSFHEDLTNQIEMNIQTNRLKHKVDDLTTKLETLSSKCLHVDAKNQVLQQIQAASQENLELLRENYNASIRSQMELRIKDLESELCKMKTSLEDSNKTELEKYQQLYLEELKARNSLANKLNEANERLAEISTQLRVEKEQRRTLLTSLPVTPVLEPPFVGTLKNNLVLNRNLAPRENLVIPPSNPTPSNTSMETYLTKMRQELDKAITRELEKDAAEFASEFPRTSPLGSADSASEDPVLKASQEYLQILRKNYMI